MSKQDTGGLARDKTLLDEYAGLAMQGLCVGAVGILPICKEVNAYAHGPCNSAIVDRANRIAAAMIAEKQKRES